MFGSSQSALTPPTALLVGGLLVADVLLFGMVIFLFVGYRSIQRKLHAFFAGKTGTDLESVLLEQLKNTQSLDQEIQELFAALNRLRDLTLRSLHKIAVLRFNPFKETGGNQSFSVALLDGSHSGVVISSLHTREGTRVYAKPVMRGKEENFPFTEEEQAAIRKAIETPVHPDPRPKNH